MSIRAPLVVALMLPGEMLPGPENDIAEARAAIQGGEAEKALDLVEPLLRSRKDDPEVWYLAGAGSLLFARQSIEARRRGVEANLIDAVSRFVKADELARAQDGGTANFGPAIHVLPIIGAIDALVLQGKSAEAAQLGSRHATHLDSLGLKLPAPVLARFAVRRGEAAARAAIAAKQAKKKGADKSIEAAREALTRARSALEKLGKAPLPLAKLQEEAEEPFELRSFFTAWKDLELWAAKPAGAVRALGQGAELGSAEDAGALIGLIPPNRDAEHRAPVTRRSSGRTGSSLRTTMRRRCSGGAATCTTRSPSSLARAESWSRPFATASSASPTTRRRWRRTRSSRTARSTASPRR